MVSQEAFARQLKSQIKDWEQQVADYEALIKAGAGDLQATHEKNLEAIKTALKQANDIQEQVQKANDTAWSHMQSSTEAAIKQLANGWLDAVQSYRFDK